MEPIYFRRYLLSKPMLPVLINSARSIKKTNYLDRLKGLSVEILPKYQLEAKYMSCPELCKCNVCHKNLVPWIDHSRVFRFYKEPAEMFFICKECDLIEECKPEQLPIEKEASDTASLVSSKRSAQTSSRQKHAQ